MKILKTYKLFENVDQRIVESVCELLRDIEKSYKELLFIYNYKQNYFDIKDFIYNSEYPFEVDIDELEILEWVNVSISNFEDLIDEKTFEYLMKPLDIDVDTELKMNKFDFTKTFLTKIKLFSNLNSRLSWEWNDIDDIIDLNDYLGDDIFPYDMSYDEVNFDGWSKQIENIVNILLFDNVNKIDIDLFYSEHKLFKKYFKNAEKLEKFEFQKKLFEEYKEDQDFIKWFFDYIKPNKELLEMYPLDDLDTYYNMTDIGLF